MEVAKDRVVSIDYTLKDQKGNLLETSQGREPLRYIHGQGQIMTGLESALEGAGTGEKKDVTVTPEKGYGPRDQSLVRRVSKNVFEGVEGPEVGMRFRARTQEGERIFAVTDIAGDTVTIDGNHPLAGVTLKFQVEVKDVREATREELAQRRARPPE